VLGDARSFEQLGSNYTAEQYISAVSAAEEELGARADQAMARLDPEYERQVRETVAELDRQIREQHAQFLRQMAAEEPMRLREIAHSYPKVASYLVEYGITISGGDACWAAPPRPTSPHLAPGEVLEPLKRPRPAPTGGRDRRREVRLGARHG
jgi:hypothetical protein